MIVMKQYLLILIAPVFLLTGCATKNVKDDFSLISNPNGLLVFSLTQTKKPGTQYAVSNIYYSGPKKGRFESQSDEAGAADLIKHMLRKENKKDFDDVVGKLVVAELPSGSYEFNNWRITSGQIAVTPKSAPESIKFSILPNTITYTGNYHFHLDAGQNIFNMKILADAYPEIQNMSDRDLTLLVEKYPQLHEATIIESIQPQKIWGLLDTKRDVAPIYIPPS